MPISNAELVSLLREALESVNALADEYESLMLATETEEKQRELARRIKTAIEKAEAPVEWKHHAARMGRYRLHTYRLGWPTPTEWFISIGLPDGDVYRHGFKTEQEAQDAAVALVLDWREE